MVENNFEQRQLHWPNGLNIRDLGQLPAESSKETSMGRLVRADTLERLTPDGIAQLVAYGIRTIIDLRAPHELERSPSPFANLSWDGQYFNRPLEKFYPHVGQKIRQANNRGEVYCIILDHYPDMFAALMRTILERVEVGGILFHCHSGTDRTGTVSALLLRLAGVPDKLIVADYAQSQINLLRQATGKPADPNDESVSFWARPTSTADMMVLMLQHIDSIYGGVEGYLQFAGLSRQEIAQLGRMLHA